jgi:hypothetical protein
VFIELVDHLRCLRPHAESWLVASADRMQDRAIVEGVLGCPVCRAEYPVRGGVAWFTEGAGPAGTTAAEADPSSNGAPTPDEVLRAAALLGLTEPGGFVLLTGEWAAFARPLRALVDVHVVLLNPPGPRAPVGEAGVSVIEAPPDALPLAGGVLRAAALGAAAAHAPLAPSVVLALRARGRLLAPAAVPRPGDVAELARDHRHWVAERAEVASAPVPLGRRPR